MDRGTSGLHQYYSMHTFRQGALLLYLRLTIVLLQRREKHLVYLRGLLEYLENHYLVCLKSGNILSEMKFSRR